MARVLAALFGISATQSLLPFTFLLVLYALLMPVTGFYIDRMGVGKITAIGGVVTGIGYILSSLATNIILLTITYGVIASAGVGIAYGVPLAVSAKWFPDRKGLAVGDRTDSNPKSIRSGGLCKELWNCLHCLWSGSLVRNYSHRTT